MKIIIASQDRTADIGPDLKSAADALHAAAAHAAIVGQHEALALRDAKTESEFLDRWTELARRKSNIDLARIEIPAKPGAAGAIIRTVRTFLWKLLRYQHARIIARQNLVNSQFAATLEFQQEEIRKLRTRVSELEQRRGGSQ